VEARLLQELGNKSITKQELLRRVEKDFNLLPTVLDGVSSSKATVRYGCAAVLTDLSQAYPEKLYPHMDFFIAMLDSKYRILVWNAMAIAANLARVDRNRKFDAAFTKYYSFLNDKYMVTVANAVGHSGKIASAKPYLAQRIADQLLKVGRIATTPHLTEECRRVIAEKAIESLDMFFDKIGDKKNVVDFVKSQLNSPRKTLTKKAEDFLRKWDH
jgi:hypothetical protein